MMAHIFIPSTGMPRQTDVCEFEASLVHTVHYRSYGERPYVRQNKTTNELKEQTCTFIFYEL